MVIFKDSLIIIAYDSGTQILRVRWRSIRQRKMFELEESIHTLVGNISDLNVEKLLLYSVRKIQEIPFNKFESFMLLLISTLAESGLKKVARMIYNDSEVPQITENSTEINEGMGIRYQYRTFSEEWDAVDWLNQ